MEIDITASGCVFVSSTKSRYLPSIQVKQVLIYKHSNLGGNAEQVTVSALLNGQMITHLETNRLIVVFAAFEVLEVVISRSRG